MSYLCKRQKCLCGTHTAAGTHMQSVKTRDQQSTKSRAGCGTCGTPKATNKAVLSFKGNLCNYLLRGPTTISFGVKTGNMLAAHKKNPHIFTEASWYTPWAQWARASSSSASPLPAWGSSSRSTLTAPRHTGQCHTPNKKSANGVPHGWWSTATVPCLCHGRKALPNNGGGFSCCPAAGLTHSTKSTKPSLATRLAGQNCGQPPKAWVRNINCLN